MAELVYLLCAAMSTLCAVMLLRGYAKTRTQLLFWSGLCFVGLAMNNVVLFVDVVVLPDLDFSRPFWRNLLSAISGSVLLYGLIWELT